MDRTKAVSTTSLPNKGLILECQCYCKLENLSFCSNYVGKDSVAVENSNTAPMSHIDNTSFCFITIIIFI